MAAINVYCSSAAPSAAPDIRLWLLWRSDDWCNHPVFSQQALNFIQKMCMEMYKKKNNNVGTLLQNIGVNTRLNIIIMEHDTSDNSLRTRRAYLSCRKNNAGRFSVLRLDASLWSVQEASDRICKALTVPDNLYQTSPPIKGANRFLLRLSERMNQDLIISKLLQCERSLTQVCTRWSSARGRDCVPSGERIRTRAARCQLSLCLIELFSSNTTDGPHRTVWMGTSLLTVKHTCCNILNMM